MSTNPSDSHEGIVPETKLDLPPALAPLVTLERLVYSLERKLLVLLVATLVGLSFFQVLIRNLVNFGWEWASKLSSSLIWAEPFLRHLVLLIAFFGASLAAREGRHLHIDVVSRLLPGRARMLLKAFTDLFSAFVCFLLAHATWGLIESDPESVAFRIGTLQVKAWLFCCLILGGFILVGLRFILRGAQDFWHTYTGEVEPEVLAL